MIVKKTSLPPKTVRRERLFISSSGKITIRTFAILCLTFHYSSESDNSNERNSSSQIKPKNDFTSQNAKARVPGCADLESLDSISVKDLTTKELQKFACFCGPSNSERSEEIANNLISVSCIFGSTVDDLAVTLELVNTANKSIERILLNNVEFGTSRKLNDVLMDSNSHLNMLKQMEIRKCRGSVDLSEQNVASTGTLPRLELLEIDRCELEGMPTTILTNAPMLKKLILTNDKIKTLEKMDLKMQNRNLNYLDLSGNLLRSSAIEPGSLSQLAAIKTLIFGEHNMASKILLKEIEQMNSLEELDLTRIDGLESMGQLHFATNNKLRKLVLMGCNLRSLDKGSFKGLNLLESLDLRVNLIEKISAECFSGLGRLRFLTIAGNFIREIPTASGSDFWKDLPNLLHLDIGWNELRKLNKTTFDGINVNLERLNLRNNEELNEIEDGAFERMMSLKYLNISGTKLKEISAGLFRNANLRELDVSSSSLEAIDPNSFENFKKDLEILNISKNKLRSLDPKLFQGNSAMYELDLSENNWLCDANLFHVLKLIKEKFLDVKNNSVEFELKNRDTTICDRPYFRRGQPIFGLLKENISSLNYDETIDTTTEMIVQKENTTDFDIFSLLNSTNFNSSLASAILEVGKEENTNEHENLVLNRTFSESLLDSNANDDMGRPPYDINQIKYGDKADKKDSNTLLSGVVVAFLIIVTAICVILVARKKNRSKEPEIRKREEVTTAF